MHFMQIKNSNIFEIPFAPSSTVTKLLKLPSISVKTRKIRLIQSQKYKKEQKQIFWGIFFNLKNQRF